MKLSLQRTLFEIANFLMSVLFVIPIGALIEKASGQPLYSCCIIPCISVLGFLAGRFSLTKGSSIAMTLCGVAAAVSTVLAAVILHSLYFYAILLILVTLFFSVFFFFTARKAAYTIYAPMAVSGILIHLLVMIIFTGFSWSGPAISFVSRIAICYFLLSLFAFSAKGLRKSLLKGSADKHVHYPAGIQMGNFLLVTGFIIIAAFISNIHPIFVVFSNAFIYVLKAIVVLFGLFSSLFSRRTESGGYYADEEAAGESSSNESIMNTEPKGEASWVTTGVEIFAFILVLIFLLYCGFKIIMKLRNSGAHLPAFLQRLRDSFAPMESEDYEDENESLLDAKELLRETGSRLKSALKKIQDRPQKFEDFKDPRKKIRFVYQMMMKKVITRDPSAVYKTPNEVYKSEYNDEEDFREFMDTYNRAKFSDSEITDEDVSLAKSIMKQKL